MLAAVDRDATLTALARHPDCALVLLDLTLPGAHGLDLLAQLRRDYPRLPDRRAVGDARPRHGRLGDGRRRAGLHREDVDAGRAARRGAHGARRRPQRHDATSRRARRAIGGIPGETLGLTHRQADVLRLLIQGKPNKLICRDLRLSEGTVKVHVSAILKALNVRSRAQAIAELSAARRRHRRRVRAIETH